MKKKNRNLDQEVPYFLLFILFEKQDWDRINSRVMKKESAHVQLAKKHF